MGDHAKPGGWNELILDRRFARKRAEDEAKGEFGAEDELKFGLEFLEAARDQGAALMIERAQAVIQRAGVLAAKEARFQGVEINGWDEA